MSDDIGDLTDKEKETLRLMVRGHDAKSMARELDLSVHTINDRLRAARRKLGVTSSREAARLVFEQEEEAPENLADKELGNDPQPENSDQSIPANGRQGGGRTARRYTAWIIGGLIMSALIALLLASAPFAPADGDGDRNTFTEAPAISDAAVETAARDWLEIVDDGNWSASYQAAGSTFRGLNTPENWEAASLRTRAPLGAAISREAVSFATVPAPPEGLQMVRFRTNFANGGEKIETITLQRDGADLRVAGYYID